MKVPSLGFSPLPENENRYSVVLVATEIQFHIHMYSHD